jgi:hypothetical protein
MVEEVAVEHLEQKDNKQDAKGDRRNIDFENVEQQLSCALESSHGCSFVSVAKQEIGNKRLPLFPISGFL